MYRLFLTDLCVFLGKDNYNDILEKKKQFHRYVEAPYKKNLNNRIKNGNGECVKGTKIRKKRIKQPKATNGFWIQRENPAMGGVLQLAPYKNMH